MKCKFSLVSSYLHFLAKQRKSKKPNDCNLQLFLLKSKNKEKRIYGKFHFFLSIFFCFAHLLCFCNVNEKSLKKKIVGKIIIIKMKLTFSGKEKMMEKYKAPTHGILQ